MNRPTQDHVAKQAARYELWKRLFIVAALVYMIGSTALIAYNSVQNNTTTQAIRDTQTEGSPLLKAISAQQDDIESGVEQSRVAAKQAAFIANFIRDCVEKGGDCYAQKARDDRTQFVIDTVRAACAAGFAGLPNGQRIRSTQQCVAAWLAVHDTDQSPGG